MARLPGGMAHTHGRTRRLKLFLFMPRYAARARWPRLESGTLNLPVDPSVLEALLLYVISFGNYRPRM